MKASGNLRQVVALLIALSIFNGTMLAVVLQGLGGGAGAFQGQDIMGGAAIIFKRPQRARDISGGVAMLMVKRQPKASRPEGPRTSAPPTDIARNRPEPPADRRRSRRIPVEPDLTPAVSDA